jgi:hypothetical protein
VNKEEMMMNNARRFMPAVLLASVVLLAVSAAPARADAVRFTRMAGEVTSVGNGFFMADHKKVEFIAPTPGRSNGSQIYNIDGKRIKPTDIKKGDVVHVIGQITPGGVKANYIHLQTHE